MPHEVIMPALGVAQDTGLIIAWLKQSGDAIKVGDALMEIETDKAVVEVEAQANGYLTRVSASAGDHVPVGQVVAMISDATEIADSAAADTVEEKTPSASVADNSTETLPEGKQIIMPALGMAQDTGLIVAWHKDPGDSVVATDILLEVETDKSIMEVEAGHDGYVAAILATTQQSVPVGSTIAIISAVKPEKIISQSSVVTEASAYPATQEPIPHASATTKVSGANTQNTAVAQLIDVLGDRILASPKARRVAKEQGLDLKQLAIHGVSQPYHVADIETLKTLSNLTPQLDATTPLTAQPTPAAQRVEARVPASGHLEFIEWMATHRDIFLPCRMVWLRYATAALRQITGRTCDPLIVEVRRTRDADGCYADADQSKMSKPTKKSVDLPPELVVRDFSESPITSVTTDAHLAPVLTIKRERDDYVISLDYRTEHFDESVAISFTMNFAERLTEPLRHLL